MHQVLWIKRLPRYFTASLLIVLLMLSGCKERNVSVEQTQQTLAPVTLTSQLEPEEATIGDIVTFTLTLSRESEISAELPEIDPSIEGLTLSDRGKEGPETRGGRVTESRWYRFRVERVGEFTFPSVRLTYSTPGGDREVVSDERTLTVKSVLPQEMNDILDIKPLVEIRPDRHLLFYAAALLILAALLGLVIFLKMKRKKRALPMVPPPLSPREEAEQAIAKLEKMDLLQRGEIKRYYFILSEIFRRYLERRFRIPAVERTTEEILLDLPAMNAAPSVQEEIRTFLLSADPVKFAGHVPTAREISDQTQGVKDFVHKTSRTTTEVHEAEVGHVAV